MRLSSRRVVIVAWNFSRESKCGEVLVFRESERVGGGAAITTSRKDGGDEVENVESDRLSPR